VVVATGARRERPALPGADAAHVLDPAGLEAALDAGGWSGRRVAVVGGGAVGVQIGEHLAAQGARVAVLSEGDRFGAGLAPPRLWRALHALRAAGAELIAGVRPLAIERAAVAYANRGGEEARLDADRVILALPGAPDDALAGALAARGLEAHAIGDCAGPGQLEQAFLQAARAARAL
jgi:pyruvate/2-oxoglutarate dehydrogenase complex dihydrolipoamide dehydrogenase (E3) component